MSSYLKSRFAATTLLLVHAFILHAQCIGHNILVNGDLTGEEGENVQAEGWSSALSSPDLNDENDNLNSTPCYVWTDVPIASPTGGTWQSMIHIEGIEQTVPTVVGSAYSICFDYARQPINCPNWYSYNSSFGIRVEVNEAAIFTTPLTWSTVWMHACGSFVATSDSSTVAFYGTSNSSAYGGIDGICMELDPNVGIGQLRNRTLDLYPNPASSRVRINTNSLITHITATNAAGTTFTLRTDQQCVDLLGLAPGVYATRFWFATNSAPVTRNLVVLPKE